MQSATSSIASTVKPATPQAATTQSPSPQPTPQAPKQRGYLAEARFRADFVWSRIRSLGAHALTSATLVQSDARVNDTRLAAADSAVFGQDPLTAETGLRYCLRCSQRHAGLVHRVKSVVDVRPKWMRSLGLPTVAAVERR